MKKRVIASMLTASMVLGMMTGCGSKENEAANTVEVAGTEDAATETAKETESADTTENAETEEEAPVINAVRTERTEPYVAELPTEAEEADIYVEPIEGISDDFIKGIDLSSVIAEEESGVVYYNEDGEPQDIFQTLADAGVNYIRVRVWNMPYDREGNGFGGGNNDVEKAAEIGKRAADYGMKLCVDFHYSDFWADPAKQTEPRDWNYLSTADKEQALYDYTKESLETIIAAGADVGMVQLGNETNNGMSGETDWEKIIALMKRGSEAVREVSASSGKDIQIAVHFTNVNETEKIMEYPARFEEAGLDYDIFGVSYYPYWHGTMESLTSTLKNISETFNKKVAVMETAYAYTLEEGDGFGNSVSDVDLIAGYAATVQSQANAVRDVMAATAAAGEAALGVFYWEGAWIPVGDADAAANSPLWEKYGSGWASSYSVKYDPDDAGKYYGGCSWDNQALFDFDGKPLASLNVFKYVNHGTICEPAVDYVEETIVNINLGEELVLPETVNVAFNNRSLSGPVPVTWNEADYKDIDTSVAGECVVNGTLEDGTAVSCTLSVAQVNWLLNPSFEEKNVTMWNVAYEGSENPTDVQNKSSDAVTGENSFHFWSEDAQKFTVEQTVSGLAEGNYTIQANIQGGDVGDAAEIYLYAIVNGTTYQSEPVKLSGWCVWQVPEITDIPLDGASDITVGMSVKCAGGGWGTMDDFYLFKQ